MPLFNEFNSFPESVDKGFAFRAVFQMLVDLIAKGWIQVMVQVI